MFAFKRLSYKTNTKPQQRKQGVVSIPLRRLQAPTPTVPAVVLPPEVWFMILGLVEYDCSWCKHKALCTLALVSRIFNEFATKELYQTLNLSFTPCKQMDGYVVAFEYSHFTAYVPSEALLRKKLDSLEATLRLPQGPGGLIRHLILPGWGCGVVSMSSWDHSRDKHLANIIYNYGKDRVPLTNRPWRSSFLQLDSVFRNTSSDNTSSPGILPRWLTIFELCSTNLESVSNLGTLWTHLYFCNRSDLRSRLCTAIEKNPHWIEWDWCWRSWGWTRDSVLTVEPRLLSSFHTWKNIRSITVDNVGWAVQVLAGIPAGQLENLRIHTMASLLMLCDLKTLLRAVPVTGLRSLSVRVKISSRAGYNRSISEMKHFDPLVDYLQRSSLTAPSMLTILDLRCTWESYHPTFNIPTLLSSIFTLTPALTALTLIFDTWHEGPIREPPMATAIPPPVIAARHLHTLTLSLPSRNDKSALASAISSGCFPALERFTFRSAFSRASTLGFCPRCPADPAEMLISYDFAKAQDQALVNACRNAAIKEWEMQILNIPYVCFAFSLEEWLEDDEKSLYFRKPQEEAGKRTGMINRRVFESSYERGSRGIVCDIYAREIESRW